MAHSAGGDCSSHLGSFENWNEAIRGRAKAEAMEGGTAGLRGL